MRITFGDTDREAEVGDIVELRSQTQEVVTCQETGVKMLNVDLADLKRGDMVFMKELGLAISNPDTTDPVALPLDYNKDTLGERIAMWWETDSDDDSEFFTSLSDDDDDDDGDAFIGLLAGAALGALSDGDSDFGGFDGGSSFGGFGGGSFSGGGASGAW